MSRKWTNKLGLGACLLAVVCLAALGWAEEAPLQWMAQRRGLDGGAILERASLVPSRTVVVVVDMWDRHWCKTYTARVANMVPRMNRALAAARQTGMQVVWAPSDVVNFYKDHPRRLAMTAIPTHPEPREVSFSPPAPPEGLDCCECGPDRPCPNGAVWTRQHPGLQISETDLIADGNNGRELFNLCGERGYDTVIYLGVASNICVCQRPFGMLNARRHGLRTFFVRDLVEAITANGLDPATKKPDGNFTPAKGSARTERYLEQHVASSFESRQMIAAAGLAEGDRRPHIVFVMADDEYEMDRTLPAFAHEQLARDYRCTFCLAQGVGSVQRHLVPDLEALYDADLVVLAMRRRALPVPQMDLLERYLRSGKPVVALRISVVAFQAEAKDRPDGHVVWRDFDREVLGCQYAGYNAEARKTGADVWPVAEAESHPILQGLAGARFHSPMWIYRVNPLASTCQVLLRGRWSEREPEEPVAWTNTRDGMRLFYTCLGHPDDFAIPAFQRLLLNAIRWATGKESAQSQ